MVRNPIRYWKIAIALSWILLCAPAAFAVDNMIVSGITGDNSSANGTYLPFTTITDGTPSKVYEVWKFVNGANIYYLFHDNDNYWDLGKDYTTYMAPSYLFYYINPSAAGSPAGLSPWNDASNIAVSNFTVTSSSPEIGIFGNAIEIEDGHTTTGFGNHTQFGSIDVASGSVSRTFTIKNLGLSALSITGSSITGANASDFTITSAPASSVAASGQTTITVKFDPSALGSRTATINIVSNDADEGTYDFSIEGYGYTPSNLVVSGLSIPAPLNGIYVHQGVLNGEYEYWKHSSASYYIYRSVHNYQPGWWFIDTDTDTSTYLYTQYYGTSPTTAKDVKTWANPSAQLNNISITDYVAAPEISVLGNSISIANNDATPSSVDSTFMGTAEVGSGSITRTFSIQNLGGTNLDLTGSTPLVTLSGPNASDFTVSVQPTTPINSGKFTTFQITFTPLGDGAKTATVSIANNDGDENPFTFAIKGGGVYAKGLTVSGVSPTAVNGDYTYQGISNGFASWVHTSGAYKIFNYYDAANERNNWEIDTDLNRDNGTCFESVDPNTNPTPIGIPANMWAIGSAYGTQCQGSLVFAYYGSEINLQGNGTSIVSGDLTPSATDFTDFGSVLAVSGSISRSFTIQNSGKGSLYLTGSPKVAISGANASDFTVTAQPASPIAAVTGSTTFTVVFDPSATGTRSATLTIINDATDEGVYSFGIQGVGLIVPTVTSITPTAGPTAGGTTVTITGTNLTGATTVKFGATNATSFTVNSATQITAISPAGTGTVDVTVTTAGGTSGTVALDQYTYVAAPTVTSISPVAGPTSGGTSVVITGTNFTGTTAVTFGATNAIGFTVNSATSITAIAPAGSGVMDVRVTTAGGISGTSAADRFTYVDAPLLITVSPSMGPAAGGTAVIITGAYFTGTTSVKFGAINATSFTVISSSQITAIAPAGSGTVDVRVTTVGGTSATIALGQYTYVAAPIVTSVTPNLGPISGGTTVTITGTNFTGTTAVKFGATNVTVFTVNSATQITATSPAGTGTVDVTVTTAGGTSATSTSDQYTYLPVPTVTSISPSSGSLFGGTSVTITGTALTGATSVTIGGVAASCITVNSSTSITVTAPPGSLGAQNVVVSTPGGTGTGVGLFTYEKATQTISFSSLQSQTYGTTFVKLTASASSSLPVSYASANSAAVQISNDTAYIFAADTATITANQVGNASYAAAASVSRIMTVFKKDVTIAGVTASNKVYDGNTVATLSGGTFVDTVEGDVLTLIPGTGTFADKNVGTAKAVTASGYSIAGADAGNYSLVQPTGLAANITAASLAITGAVASNKVYDGTNTATVTGTTLAGKVISDNVALVLGTATFVTKDVGNAKSVSVTGSTLSGSDHQNYLLTEITGLTANITARQITLSGVSASNKVYDGNTVATLSGGTFVDTIADDVLTLLKGTGIFADQNVGTAKVVTASGYSITGADAGNYTLTQPAGIAANITPYLITVTAEAKSIQQGDDDVALTYTADNLLGNDAFTGVLTRDVGDTAGTYAILQGTLSAGSNYIITYHDANYVITEKPVIINPVVPFATFTGRANARIFNLQGVQVWSGMLDVNDGRVTMPNIGARRWVVKVQIGTTDKIVNAWTR